MLDWNDLKWFVAVADAGSYRQAAADLGVNHTTLSRHMRALEEELGLALIQRSPTGLTLTEAGAELRTSCQVLVDEIADLKLRLAGKDQRPEGRVTVTYADGFAPTVVRAIAELGQLYPDIEVVQVNTEDHVDISNRDADIAVRAAFDPPGDLLGRRVGSIRWALYGAKSLYPEPPEKFIWKEHDWVGFAGRWKNAPPTRWLEANVPAERIKAKVDAPQSIRELALAGVGLGMLMCIDGDQDPRLTRVADWPGDPPPTNLWLLVHPDVSRARRVRVVADFLYERLRQTDEAYITYR